MLWILTSFFTFLLFHVIFKLPFIIYCPQLIRLYATVLLKEIKISEIVEKIDFNTLQSNSQIFPDKTGHITILNSLYGSWNFFRFVENAFIDLFYLLINPQFVLFHKVEKKGDFDAYFRQGFILACTLIELALPLQQPSDKGLPFVNKKSLLERHLYHFLQGRPLEDSEEVTFAALHQHHCLRRCPQVPNQLDVSKKLLKRYLSRWQDLFWCFYDLAESWDLLFHDTAKGLLLMLVDVAFIVSINFLSPKLFQPELLLDLVFEEAKLRRKAKSRKDGLSLLESDWLRRTFDRLWGFLDALRASQGVLGLLLIFGVVLFTLPNFQRHIKLLLRPQQLPQCLQKLPRRVSKKGLGLKLQLGSALRQIARQDLNYNTALIMGRASKKDKQPSSEEEEQHESEQEFDEEDEDGILAAHPEDDLDEAQRNAALLQEIKAVAAEVDEGQQLTWNAIYTLKKEQGDLNAKMEQEIQAIREKYELLKQPIFQQISNAALGIKLDSKLYRPEGLPCRGNPDKTPPKAIPDFWGVVFEKEGLISSQVDVECFSKVKELSCTLLDFKTNHIRVIFRFSSQTQYFSNLELQVDTRLDTQSNVPVREIKEELKYKGERQEASLFTMLFDSKTEVHETYSFASQFYQDYSNSLYFYFKDDEDQGQEADAEAEQGEGEEEEEDEESEEVQAVEKPKKKKKEEPKEAKKEKKEIEKPECKQQ